MDMVFESDIKKAKGCQFSTKKQMAVGIYSLKSEAQLGLVH